MRPRVLAMTPGQLVTCDSRRLSALDLVEVRSDHGGRMEPNVCTLTQPEADEVLVPPRRFIEIPSIPSKQLSVLFRRDRFPSHLCQPRCNAPQRVADLSISTEARLSWRRRR